MDVNSSLSPVSTRPRFGCQLVPVLIDIFEDDTLMAHYDDNLKVSLNKINNISTFKKKIPKNNFKINT